VQALQGLVDQAGTLDIIASEAHRMLALMIDALALFKAHRLMILQAIEEIDRPRISEGWRQPDPGRP
jgi:hypothetical protein